MTDQSTLIEQGERCLHQGQWEAAKMHFDQALAKTDSRGPALHGLGVVSAQQGEMASAADYFQQALAAQPDNALWHSHMGNVLVALKRLDEAVHHYQQAIDLDSTLAQAHNNLGNVHYRGKAWEQAIACYQAALALQPDYIDATHNLGQCYFHLERWAEAITELKIICAQTRHPVGAARNLGLAFYFSHQTSEAIPHFHDVLIVMPDDVEVLNYLAGCYLAEKDLPAAKDYYERALVMTPDDPQISYNLGVINTQQTHYDAAINYYQATLALQPTHWAAHHNIANVYIVVGQKDQARRHFQAILQAHPENEIVKFQWAALVGEAHADGVQPSSPPEGYVKMLFDQYADHYDESLETALAYRAPELLFAAVQTLGVFASSPSKLSVLDLGCGTGLTGAKFKSECASLVGVDLSSEMIALAKQKNLYDALRVGDVVAEVQEMAAAQASGSNLSTSYDLVLAADVLPYVGALNALFAGVRSVLASGGYFALTVEHSELADASLQDTGRYAHSEAYVRACAREAGFEVSYMAQETLRMQAGEPVVGGIYVLGLV